MKTQIIRLDAHDDLISARDKMNWNQASRILLVWPEQGRVLRRRLDLILLQRHSASLGAQLALVTRDKQVRYHARQLGIPLFLSLRQAQAAHWRSRQRLGRSPRPLPAPRPLKDVEALRLQAHPASPPWLSQPATRLTFFTLGVVAILLLGAALLSRAEISLSPALQTQQLTLTVRADPGVERINYAGIIPARPLSVVVEGRRSLLPANTAMVPDQYATGKVVFTNLSDQPLTIPAGLVVRTVGEEAVRFATIQSGSIAPGPGITVTLPVRAITPGPAGNLPANSLIAIEGDLGLRLTATNPEPTRGGTQRPAPFPSAQERQSLYHDLESQLRQTALDELRAQLTGGDLIFTSTLTVTQVLEARYEPAEGQPGTPLQLSLRLEYQALSAMQEDLRSLVGAVMDANLPEGYKPRAESLQISPLTRPETSLEWRIQARREVVARLPVEQIANMILGLSPQRASERLSASLPLAAPPRIHLIPAWWPRLPLLPLRIAVVVQETPSP